MDNLLRAVEATNIFEVEMARRFEGAVERELSDDTVRACLFGGGRGGGGCRVGGAGRGGGGGGLRSVGTCYGGDAPRRQTPF